MDCLITKLPGEVSDGTLSKFDEISFNVHLVNSDSTNDRKLVAKCLGIAYTARIVGNGHFTDSTNTSDLGKTATIGTANTTLYLSDGDYILYIPKYQLDVLQFAATKTGIYRMRGESLAYTPIVYGNFNYVGWPEGYSMDDFKKSSFIILNIGHTNLDLSTEKLSGLTSVTTLGLTDSPNLRGSIANLAGNTAMTNLYVNVCPNATGAIEDLLDGLYANGKKSGSLIVNAVTSGITYNGAAFSLKTFNFSSSGWVENT